MRFIVDAQLPRRLAHEITALGSDAIHTLDLREGNLTSDQEVIRVANEEQRVVVTKDSDFVDSLILKGQPERLLFITTGNIPNSTLIHLIQHNWPTILSMLEQGQFVEMSRTAITLHQL